MKKILVADDHALVRDLIVSSIQQSTDYQTETADDYDAALALIETSGAFDLVLLDYQMPGMNGIEGISTVIAANSNQPVALMSGVATRQLAEDALRRGAGGILPKSMHLRSMMAAIDFMMAGEVYTPFEMAVSSDRPPQTILTNREQAVLEGLCEGLSNKEIARDLELHETTVKMHVRSISRKLEARNRTHAAMIAKEKRLV